MVTFAAVGEPRDCVGGGGYEHGRCEGQCDKDGAAVRHHSPDAHQICHGKYCTTVNAHGPEMQGAGVSGRLDGPPRHTTR